MNPRAPIFVRAYDLCKWIHEHFDQNNHPLNTQLCKTSLQLLDQITLALKQYERDARLDCADENLIRLRIRLRLAGDLGLLDDKQLLFALEQTDDIGRQLGGWRRKMDVR